ncbi:MAG: DUF6153 family protein [Actinobacteria bacterium]|nr:DUF6153 family protein [Actinomycetota bacterium]
MGRAGLVRHRWLLIIVIAAGLISMHHLVHLHTGHTGHSHPAPVAVTSTAVAHADCCNPMDMVGHFCLAVLAASTALVVALALATLALATLWRRAVKPGSVFATVSAVAARAPPIGGPRFTQLCVLRC